jgi:transketolase
MDMASVDMRDAFFDAVYALGAGDRDVVVITDDMDAFGLRRFKGDFPGRFINIGVAEQNMINVAAGLALCGKKVFTYGIASFVTMRCFEQIKVNLCSLRLPVVIIGVGAGFSFGFDGPTHHGTQDVAVMRALPEMTIYNPSDAALAAACPRLALGADGPSYVRLDKGTFPVLHDPGDAFADGFAVARPLRDVNLVATGFMTHRAVQVADALKARAIDAGVVDAYRLKPIGERFLSAVVARSRVLVTVEEHSIVGGLGTAIGELLVDSGSTARLTRLAVPDRQFLEYGGRDWFLGKHGLAVGELADRCAAIVERS